MSYFENKKHILILFLSGKSIVFTFGSNVLYTSTMQLIDV